MMLVEVVIAGVAFLFILLVLRAQTREIKSLRQAAEIDRKRRFSEMRTDYTVQVNGASER